MVLSFEGPRERKNQLEFRCFYLPSEASFGFTDAEGWTTYLSDQGEGANLPYIISASNVYAGTHKSVINGEVTFLSYYGRLFKAKQQPSDPYSFLGNSLHRRV